MFGRSAVKLELRHQLALLEGTSNHYTPDIAKLEEYETQRLFVFDEWMSDRRQNFVIDEMGVRRGAGFTKQKFQFRVFNGFLSPDWTPVANKDPEGYVIKGEIVEILPSSFLLLDKLKQNGVKFIRERVKILKPSRDVIVFENTTEERGVHHSMGVNGVDWITGKFPDGHPLAGKKCWISPEKITPVFAWMYLGKHSYWNMYRNAPYLFQRVPTFKPKKDKEWLSEYYKYQNPVEG